MKSNQWLRPFLFTLLILVAPLIGYYVYFVQSRETFLLDHFHAHLSNMAARTENRFASAFDVIENNFGNSNELGIPEGGKCESDKELERMVELSGPGRLDFHTAKCDGVVVEAAVLVGDVDPEEQFYDILVLDARDKVVFQRSPDKGRIGNGNLLTGMVGDDRAKGNGDTVTDPLASLRREYQGQWFLVFQEPLAVSTSDGQAWKIIGLVEQARFNRMKYDFRPAGVALVALVLLVFLLIGPFLKLWYLGRYEPLTRFDIFLETGAGLTLVATITVALLAWNTSTRLERYFDTRLDAATNALHRQILHEFASAVQVLYTLEPMMVESYEARLRTQAPTPASATTGCPTLARAFETPASSTSGTALPTLMGDLLLKMPRRTRDYRQLRMAYLMDQQGCQLVKWASEQKWSKPGTFGDRQYFLRSLPDERRPLRLYGFTGSDRPFFQDIIVSRTTGERSIVFSKPVDGPQRSRCTAAIRDGAAERVACVSVVSGALRALDTVLPNGYGAMLVNADADIIARSGETPSTELNLAHEIDKPNRLKALLASGLDGRSAQGPYLDSDYRRKPHRFRVSTVTADLLPSGAIAPLPRADRLTLVTFYNRNLVATTVLEAVGAAATAWLVSMSLLVAVFALLWIVDDISERALRRRPAYLLMAFLGLIAFAWTALKIDSLLLLAVIGIPLSLLGLRYLTREEQHRMNAHVRRLLVVLATWVSVMLAAALPMLVFYQDAEERALGALARDQAQTQSAAAESRQADFDDWKHKVGLGANDQWKRFAVWEDQAFGANPGKIQAGTSSCGMNLVCLILRGLPDYNEDVVGMHAMYKTGSLGSAALERLRGILLGGRPDAYALQFVATGLFLVLTPAVIWYLLVRTFGLRAENVVKVSSFTEPAPGGTARYIVYGVPAEERSGYLDRLSIHGKRWIDLRDLPADADIEIPSSVAAVALDSFDVNLNDLEVVRHRIALLERLLREKRTVILVFVNTEPLNFVTATFGLADQSVLISRLATALARFQLTYHPPEQEDEGAPPASSEQRSFVGRAFDAVRRYARRPFHDTLWRESLVRAECRHPDLRFIRATLLREPDLRNWSKRQIVQQVQSRANAIYQTLWHQCTRAEKFTLIELARGNPINPNNWDAARRLHLRGFVRADPFYRIASESLKQFVGGMEQAENLASWRTESPGAWSQIKVPLIVLLLSALVFLAVTQPDLFNSMFAFLAAGVASFPFLVSALNARLQRAAKNDA